MQGLLYLALMVASAALIVTKMGIFGDVRDAVDHLAERNPKLEKLSEMIHCPVCTGWWLSLGACLAYGLVLWPQAGFFGNLVVSTFAVHGLAVLIVSVVMKNLFGK